MGTIKTAATRTSETGSRTRISRSPRRGRSLRTPLEMVALIVIAVLLVLGALTAGPDTEVSVDTTRIRTEAGDTLWGIARSHPVQGLTTAQNVELIVSLNGLDSPHVTTGGLLAVPQTTPNLAVASK